MSTNFEKFSDPTRKTLKQNGPKKRRGLKKTSRLAYYRIAGLLIGLGLYFALAHFVYDSQIVEVKENQLQQLSQLRADLTAENIKVYIESLRSKLEFYTSKPQLAKALAEKDTRVLNDTSSLIKTQVNNVVSVRFISKGEAALDSESQPPIRYSELDMIQRAERRENVPLEVAKVGNNWYLNCVLPLPFDEDLTAIGTAFVSFDLDELNRQLELNNTRLGLVRLVQQFSGGRPLTVLTIGEGGLQDKKTAKVANSHFYIEFEPSYTLASQTHVNILMVGIILIVCAVLLLCAGAFAGMYVGRKIEAKGLLVASKGVSASKQGEAESQEADLIYQPKDILDIEISEGDEALLGLDEGEEVDNSSPVEEITTEKAAPILSTDIPDEVFRAYDIRGEVKNHITKDFARKVGQAVACEALDAGENTLIVARDARLSSPELTEYLIRGILSTGCNVLNIGTVPTPLMYFATEVLDASRSGIMVTASHNPGHQNGFKIVIDGKCRSEEDIKAIRQRIIEQRLYQGEGQEHRYDIIPEYVDTIFSDVALAGEISIVIDAANAVPGVVAPRLFEELGCQVTCLYCDLDGSFPNHDPDPSIPKNLEALVAKVKETGADLGVAFDGDGDRLAVVTPKGNIVWPDRLLMLFARDVVSRNPGADVVFDVKSTRHLNACISEVGGRPIMWKTGHSPMKAKMQETGALLGGEYSGHIFIKDRWYGFDDGLYAAARLIEIISLQGKDLDTLFDEFPKSIDTPEIRVPMDEDKKFKLIQALKQKGNFASAKISTIDGLRVDFPSGWGLVRASNTGPEITLRFEAETADLLHRIKALFVRELRKIDKNININWNQ